MNVGSGPWLIVYSDVIYNAYNNKLQQNPLRDFQKHLPATARKLKTYRPITDGKKVNPYFLI